ncbi:MAG: large repetitive protein, partial [Verrucomicrobiota bacterium]
WVRIGTYNTTVFNQWTLQQMFIPPGAMAARTQFRWRQLANSGSPNDHWALDDVDILSEELPPLILGEPADRVALEGSDVSFSVDAGGLAPLIYTWTFNGAEIPGASGPVLNLHSLATNMSGRYKVKIHNPLGDVESREALLTVVDLSRDIFRIVALETNGAAMVDHLSLSGNSQGGFAASDTRLFYSGDTGTASLRLDDLGDPASIPVIYDSLVSDLRSGKVYALGTATTILSASGGLVTRLVEVDGVTGLLSTRVTLLTQPIPVSQNFYGNIGFFSGVGRAAVFNGTNAYSIQLPSGLVVDHGHLDFLAHIYPQAWAYSGVVEYFDGATWLARVGSPRTVLRTRLTDGYTSAIGEFDDLGTMGAITVAPGRNRWYFHFRGRNQFGTGLESAGYARAAFSVVQSTQAVQIVRQPRGRTGVAGTSVSMEVSATGYPLEYQWLRNGIPIPGENGFRLRWATLRSTDAGAYSVIVSNLLGAQISSEAVLKVVPPSFVSVYDDPNFVDTSGGFYSESDSVQASLQSLGNNVTTFTNVDTGLVPGRVILFPSLAYGNPASVLSGSSRLAVRQFVENGGLMVVQGAGFTVPFVNDIFGMSWLANYSSELLTPLSSQATGSAFADSPEYIPSNSTTYGLLTNSLPFGTRNIYETNGISIVSVVSIGSGRIVYLGWNWENAVPLGSQDGGWLQVLNSALQETQPPPAGLPAIAIEPEDRPTVVGVATTLGVVAFGRGPLSYQWLREGVPISGATSSSLQIAIPNVAAGGNFAVVINNSSGSVTSRTARVSVRVSRGLVGTYLDYSFYTVPYTAPELSILQAGFTPVRITNIATANLAPLAVLLLDATYSGNISPELQNRLPSIAAWVLGGGRLVVHDISGYSSGSHQPSPLLIGANRTLITSSFLMDVNVTPPGNTLVTDGPYGHITDTSLDNPGLVSLTTIDGSTLAPGMTPILQSDLAPTQYVAVSYGLGAGTVFYSTIYLNYLLQNSLSITPILRTVYLPNVIEHVLAFTPSGPPLIVQPPSDIAALQGGLVTMTAFATGLPTLRYQWSLNGVLIAGATNSSLIISNAGSASVGGYSVLVSNSLGATNSPTATLTLIEAKPFKILSLGATGAQVVDHNALTGDDRGGIAVSRNSVFITGDTTTARFSASDLSGGTALPMLYDAFVSNLRTETVYTLANGTTPLGYGGGTVDALIEVDGVTGLLTTNILQLSMPVLISPNNDAGIYSGYDAAVLHDGVRAYRIDLVTGLVSDLGFMPPPQHQSSENWAHWGIAEYFGGAMWLVAVRDSQTITRTRVPDGLTTVIGTFTSLSDMASITLSLSRDRWYFHYEGSAQFGGSQETLGYATASWDKPPVISSIGNVVMNEDSTVNGLVFNIVDDQTLAGNLVVTTHSSDTNLIPDAGLVVSGNASLRTLSITPAPNRYGTATVSIVVADSIGSAAARSFLITVLAVNDAPSFVAGSNIVVSEDPPSPFFSAWATQISAGPFETGQALSFVLSNNNPGLFSAPPTLSALGDLQFALVPNLSGTAIVTARLQDDGGTASGGQNSSASQDFTITVLAVNDPPVAFAQSVTLTEDTPVPIELTGADLEGGVLSYMLVAAPLHGSVIGGGSSWLYTPGSNYHGADSFTFKVNDGQLDSAAAVVTLLISAVNDVPAANPQVVTNREDIPMEIVLSGVDPDGDPLVYEILTSPSNGTLRAAGAAFIYQPNSNYFGLDAFTFRANDGIASSAAAIVLIHVESVNDAPVAESDSLQFPEDAPAASQRFTLRAVDADGDAVSFIIVAGPEHGTILPISAPITTREAAGSARTSALFTYTPAPGYNGPDGFSYKVNDGQADSPIVRVGITVFAVNDPPVALPVVLNSIRFFPGTINSLVLSANNSNAVVILDASLSSDPDQDPLEFAWFRDGSSVPFSRSRTTTNLFSVGTHLVVLLADDGQDSASASLSLDVITVSMALEIVLQQIEHSSLSSQRIRPLKASLKAAMASFDRGNSNSGSNQLHALQNKLKAQVSNSDPALAAAVESMLRAILDAAGIQ